jgi:hypothetical protein
VATWRVGGLNMPDVHNLVESEVLAISTKAADAVYRDREKLGAQAIDTPSKARDSEHHQPPCS